ncbi:MAG: glycosyltransferase family 39 protein [Bacteroidia bacterium]|nr:glycosyltransferase family 39 protein [Bacteroidia bacterium]
MEIFFSTLISRLGKIKPIVSFYTVVIIFVSCNYESYLTWRQPSSPFASDCDQYYSYLPATFIYKDLSYSFNERYWLVTLPNGKKMQRFTSGVAVMEAPFFAMAHYYAKANGYKLDGYSAPYAWFNYFGVFLYVLIGLYYLYRALRFYFSEWLCVFVLAAIFLATNLFFYTLGAGQMSHSFLFLLQAVFIFHMLRWWKNGKWYDAFFIGLAAGIAVLSRPSESLILLAPLFIGVKNKETFFKKLNFLWDKKWQILLAGLVFLICLCPQLFYWKYVTGHYIYYSYEKERFYFNDPQIIRFLFGWRKGLIPYAPIMIFSFIGFFFLWKKCSELFFAFLIFTIVNIYFLSCWWDYGFGGGLGNRALVQSFTFLAFPMAAFFDRIFSAPAKKYLKSAIVVAAVVLLVACMRINLLMARQYTTTAMHWGGMTKEAYWFIWNKENFTQQDMEMREKLIREPDGQKMLNGERDQ